MAAVKAPSGRIGNRAASTAIFAHRHGRNRHQFKLASRMQGLIAYRAKGKSKGIGIDAGERADGDGNATQLGYWPRANALAY